MLSVLPSSSVTVIALPTRLFPGDESYDQCRRLLLQAARAGETLIVDCARVRVFGAGVLGLLIQTHLAGGDQSPGLVLCNVPPLADEVLRLTHLAELWPVHPTVAEALDALSDPPTLIEA
jgi:anti-anti-sigma regulatory factor